MFDTEKYNQGIRYRGRKIRDLLKASLSVEDIGVNGGLLKALNTIKYKKLYGEIEAIGFTITKGGVFTAKGVGKGAPIDSAKSNGSKIGRKAKDWYNPIFDASIPEIADFVASQKADSLTNEIRFK